MPAFGPVGNRDTGRSGGCLLGAFVLFDVVPQHRQGGAPDRPGEIRAGSEPYPPPECLFSGSQDDYRTAVSDFVRDGVGSGHPVFVAVPGPKARLLRDALGEDADPVEFADMTELGRNPGRIIDGATEAS